MKSEWKVKAKENLVFFSSRIGSSKEIIIQTLYMLSFEGILNVLRKLLIKVNQETRENGTKLLHIVYMLFCQFFVIKSVFDSTWIRINWATPCKIRENSGFRWPVFSRIKTEFTILSMYGKIPVRKIPVFSHILCIVIPGYS